MNAWEEQQFEAELRRTTAARPPEEFMVRLRAGKPGWGLGQELGSRKAHKAVVCWRQWRWLAPALGGGVVVTGLLLLLTKFTPPVVAAGLQADDVQVNQELVSSYDVVAQLPGGELVRFRCRQLRDQLVVRDKLRGVVIETSSPRVEVTPVRFETY